MPPDTPHLLASRVEPAHRSDWWAIVVIFAMALGLRLTFLFSSGDRDWIHSQWYEGDAPLWVQYAEALDTGQPFWFNLPIHPPGVAYALSWVYAGVRDQGFVMMKVAWCIISAAACALVYMASAPALGRRIAWIASSLCAASFGQYLLATSINSEAPYTMLLCAMMVLTNRARRSSRWWWPAALGVLHGLSLLFRPEHLLLLLLWCFWLPWSDRLAGAKGALKAVAIMLVFTAVICLPWSVHATLATIRFNAAAARLPDYDRAPIPWSADARASMDELPAFARDSNFNYLNHLAMQRRDSIIDAADVEAFFAREFGTKPRPLGVPVLISSQGPLSFALANHPRSDGGFTRLALEHPKLDPNPTFNVTFPPHLQLYNDGYAVALRWIREQPGDWLGVLAGKFDRFLNGVAHGFTAQNLPSGRTGWREAVDMFHADSPAATAWRSLHAALIVFGIGLAMHRRVAGLWVIIIAYKLIVTALFYGYARQAASIAPAFFLFDAFALAWIAERLIARFPRLAGPMRWLGVSLLALVIVIDLATALRGRAPVPIASASSPLLASELGEGAWTCFGRVRLESP